MKYIPVLLALSILSFSQGIAQQNDPITGVDYQSQSVATVDRPLSGIVNPAALGFWTSMGLHYAHSFTDSSYKGDDGLLLASRGAFFSIEWLNHTTNIFRRKYTFAMGDRMLPNFYVGASYSWFGGTNSFYNKRKDWKVGFLYHPKPFASLGLVVDKLNEPRFGPFKDKRTYQPGIGLRPFGDKITFSADGLITEGQKFSHSIGVYRIALGPFKGISFMSDYRTNGQWRFGLAVDFQQTRIGGQARFTNENKYRGGTYYIEVGSEEYRTGFSSISRSGSMVLKSDILEEPRGKQIFGASKRSFYSIIRDLRRGASDPNITSLLVKIEDVNLDFASAQELRSALAEYRTNGKKVVAFLGEADNLEYYLASAADEIYMEPTGLLELKGIAATTRFYKGTMDKLGIRAQIISTGPHKTFGDAFVDTAMTDAAREQINWLLDDLYGQFVEGIAAGRGISPEKVKSLIDAGPYTAQNAGKAGLLDGLKHFDELTENDGPFADELDLSHFYAIPDYNPRWTEPRRIALVFADGSISQGDNGSSLLEGKVIGSATMTKSLKAIRNDPSIEAVVFRVNSPGGDVFASDEIYRQLVLLKKDKPLVISMGGVAASGGYYISCPGDEILASPGTITGSIGVVIGKVDLSGFYQKIGINNETITRGAHADIRSSTRPATEEEMAIIDTMMWQYYDDFVTKVSTWRNLDFDSVDAIGEGRVWTGHQAKEYGLVDGYGGIYEAIEEARQRAGIDLGDRIEIDTYPVYSVSIVPSFGAPSLESQISSILGRADQEDYYYKPAYEIKIK
jgi:protease IV